MILFVSYGGGHISIVKPLLDYFNKNGMLSQILPLSTAIPFLQSREYTNFLKLEDLCSYECSVLSEYSFIDDLINRAHDSNSGIPFSFTRAYYAIGFHDLIHELGSYTKALQKYRKMGRFSFCPTLFSRKVLLMLKPRAVFVTNLPRYESAFVESANALGIPTYGIDDLFGTRTNIPNVSTMFVDNIIAYNNYKKNRFKGRLVLSGNPVFEILNEKLRNVSENSNSKRLLVLLQPLFYKYSFNNDVSRDIHFYKELWNELEARRFWDRFDEVITRIHPSMVNGERYLLDFMKKDKNIDLHDSISSVNYVLGFSSTSLYEAVISGKKYIALNVEGINSFLPIKYSGSVFNSGRLKEFNDEFIVVKAHSIKNSKRIILNYVRDELLCNRK